MAFTEHMQRLPLGVRMGVEEIASSGEASFILLFGSRARGSEGPLSDVDIAVSSKGRTTEHADWVLCALPRMAGPDCHVDLVDLDRAPVALRYRVARDGTPLWIGDEHALHRFKVDANRDWLDFEPMLRVHDAALKMRMADGTFARGTPRGG